MIAATRPSLAATRTLTLAACIAIAFVPGVIGARFAPDAWYAALVKPTLTPPGWVFPIVWTALYLTIGIALYRVITRSATDWLGRGLRIVALAAFSLQWLLNAMWSWLFFGHHMIGGAFAVIVGLWLTIAVTVIAFWWIDRRAGQLLAPYWAWVTFAAYLNAALLALN